jgi:hypothetical protein
MSAYAKVYSSFVVDHLVDCSAPIHISMGSLVREISGRRDVSIFEFVVISLLNLMTQITPRVSLLGYMSTSNLSVDRRRTYRLDSGMK